MMKSWIKFLRPRAITFLKPSAIKSIKPWALTAFALLLFPPLTLAQYTRTDLVSNQAGVAPFQEKLLVNAWGLVSLPKTPFWVSDNGTGFSTLYNGSGQQLRLFVTIPPSPATPPPATGGPAVGSPSGVVGNISGNPTDFSVTENGITGRSIFIFATLDGTISGWSPGVAGIDPKTGATHATIAVPNSGNGAFYTGLAIANNGGQTLLYAADGGPNRRIDVFNANFQPATQLAAGAFEDPNIPRDFTPYGIQNINGDIWVTYTALNKAQGGFVDKFGADGSLKVHDAVRGPLHSPWGLAQAPADFGPMSNAILVSNNTSRGRINAFDATTGAFLGPLRDANGNAIEIDNVWALQFGQDAPGGANGTHKQLFFTAGPNGYSNGLFGVIEFKP